MTLVPPLRYTQLSPHVHRGSYPRPVNFPYLRRLQLKTIISLTPDPITLETDPALYEYLKREQIEMIHFPMTKESKKKFKYPSNHQVLEILKLLIDTRNSPVYMHCLNGGVVTSLVVACLRKVQLWNTIAIFREFSIFSQGVLSLKDRAFIEGFRVELKDVVEYDDGGVVADWLWTGLSMDVVSKHPTLSLN
jgi:tyrosine-protein phosphatase OCA6